MLVNSTVIFDNLLDLCTLKLKKTLLNFDFQNEYFINILMFINLLFQTNNLYNYSYN